MNKKILLIALVTLIHSNAFAEGNYLCVSDLESGFHHDDMSKSWEHATFLPGERFEIHELRKGILEVKNADPDRKWSAICTPRTDLTGDSFSCSNGTRQFHFNRKLRRFTSFKFFGYWNGSRDSLSISLGQCYAN